MLVHRVHGKKWWFRAPWLPSVSSGGFFYLTAKTIIWICTTTIPFFLFCAAWCNKKCSGNHESLQFPRGFPSYQDELAWRSALRSNLGRFCFMEDEAVVSQKVKFTYQT
jgi:hypothetical protein